MRAFSFGVAAAVLAASLGTLQAQTPPKTAVPGGGKATPAQPAASVELPPDYVIGAEDVLGVTFWREKDISADVVVRPDGKISLLLLNDIVAAGLTVDELRLRVGTAAKAIFADGQEPTVSVIVKQINSRNVYIAGAIRRTGKYPMTANMTILQLIIAAGGLEDWAKKDQIVIVRNETGKPPTIIKVNYEELVKNKNLAKNLVVLRPGDSVIVPD